MAQVLRLADYAQSTTYNLITGAVRLRYAGWRPGRGQSNGATTIEAFHLVGIGTDTAIIAAEDSIGEMIRKVGLWQNDKFKTASIWLEANTTNEATKRALIVNMRLQQVTTDLADPMLTTAGSYLLTIEHLDWEAVSATAYTHNNVSAWGGKATIAASEGNIDGRISNFKLAADTGTMERVWVGIRPTYDGISAFDPVLELEDGTATAGNGGAVATIAGASPSGSAADNVIRVTLTNTALVKRSSISIGQHVGSDYDHFKGEYRVLLRCKVSSSTTVGIQLKTARTNGNVFRANQEVYGVDNTGWQLIDLGDVSIPNLPMRATMNAIITAQLQYFEFRIFAEVITSNGGTDLLDMDALVLVPVKHFSYAEGLTLDPASSDILYIFDNEDRNVDVIETANGNTSILGTPLHSLNNWQYPVDGGVLVAVGQRAATHELADQVDVVITMVPQWQLHNAYVA